MKETPTRVVISVCKGVSHRCYKNAQFFLIGRKYPLEVLMYTTLTGCTLSLDTSVPFIASVSVKRE